jgi:hypothetical protein
MCGLVQPARGEETQQVSRQALALSTKEARAPEKRSQEMTCFRFFFLMKISK